MSASAVARDSSGLSPKDTLLSEFAATVNSLHFVVEDCSLATHVMCQCGVSASMYSDPSDVRWVAVDTQEIGRDPFETSDKKRKDKRSGISFHYLEPKKPYRLVFVKCAKPRDLMTVSMAASDSEMLSFVVFSTVVATLDSDTLAEPMINLVGFHTIAQVFKMQPQHYVSPTHISPLLPFVEDFAEEIDSIEDGDDDGHPIDGSSAIAKMDDFDSGGVGALHWCFFNDNDFMWTSTYDVDLLMALMCNGMFLLPHSESVVGTLRKWKRMGATIPDEIFRAIDPKLTVMFIPNPSKRYCIDFRVKEEEEEEEIKKESTTDSMLPMADDSSAIATVTVAAKVPKIVLRKGSVESQTAEESPATTSVAGTTESPADVTSPGSTTSSAMVSQCDDILSVISNPAMSERNIMTGDLLSPRDELMRGHSAMSESVSSLPPVPSPMKSSFPAFPAEPEEDDDEVKSGTDIASASSSGSVEETDDGGSSKKRLTKWARNRKVKKYAGDFYLSVNLQFEVDLEQCREYHLAKHKRTLESEVDSSSGAAVPDSEETDEDCDDGTWLNEELMQLLLAASRQTAAASYKGPLQMVVFELWDRKNTSKPVAANFGFAVGKVFSDYTFMTLARDKRSCGSVLTRVIGDILQRCGFHLWYWGFRLEYMAEYDSYGGTVLEALDFFDVLKKGAAETRRQRSDAPSVGRSVLDIMEFVRNGNALIAPLPEWRGSS